MQRRCTIILDTFPVTWIGHLMRLLPFNGITSVRTSLIFLMPTVTLLSVDDLASIRAATRWYPIKNVGFQLFPSK